eukprot:7260241-Prymnesium_polylepis.1
MDRNQPGRSHRPRPRPLRPHDRCRGHGDRRRLHPAQRAVRRRESAAPLAAPCGTTWGLTDSDWPTWPMHVPRDRWSREAAL